MNANLADAHYYLGTIYDTNGQTPLAVSEYQKISKDGLLAAPQQLMPEPDSKPWDTNLLQGISLSHLAKPLLAVAKITLGIP